MLALKQTAAKRRSARKSRPQDADLPDLDAAKSKLDANRGLFCGVPEDAVQAFMDYDGPVVVGSAHVRKD